MPNDTSLWFAVQKDDQDRSPGPGVGGSLSQPALALADSAASADPAPADSNAGNAGSSSAGDSHCEPEAGRSFDRSEPVGPECASDAGAELSFGDEAELSFDADGEVDLADLRAELSAADREAVAMAMAEEDTSARRQWRQWATPTKRGRDARNADGNAQKQGEDATEEGEGPSPAKSLGTEATTALDVSSDSFRANGSYDDDDVESGLPNKTKKKNNTSNKNKTKTTREGAAGGGEAAAGRCLCDRCRCPTRYNSKMLGFGALLAVLAGTTAYLFAGGAGGGPLWRDRTPSEFGAVEIYIDPPEEEDDSGGIPVINVDDASDPIPPPPPPGCADDGTWAMMRRDAANPGGFVLTSRGCRFVRRNPAQYCDASGVASVVGGDRGTVTEATRTAREACPVSCGTCPVPAPPTSHPTATPTAAPTSDPTDAPTAAPTSRPTASPTSETEGREDERYFYDWDAVIADGAAYGCPNAKKVEGWDLFADRTKVGRVASRLSEASGLASSRVHRNVLYTHEDAGDLNEFYAIDADSGAIVGDYVLRGTANRDYEDIAVGPGPVRGASYVYVGDIGDNSEKRGEGIRIYRIRESLLQIGEGVRQKVTDYDTLTLAYHDGSPQNSEAFFFDPTDHLIYIIRKEKGMMWRTPTRWGPGDATMVLVPELDIRSNPNQGMTAADMSADGRELLLKYSGSVRYYCREPGQSMTEILSNEEPIELPYTREPRGEAVAFAADRADGYYTLSESNGDGRDQPLYHYERIKQ